MRGATIKNLKQDLRKLVDEGILDCISTKNNKYSHYKLSFVAKLTLEKIMKLDVETYNHPPVPIYDN